MVLGGGALIPQDWKGIVRESSPLIALMMLIEIAGGGALQSMDHIFYALPIFLALVPLINAIGGNAGSIIGSRMASGLHLGTIEPSFRDKEVMENMAMTAGMGMSAKLISALFLFALFPFLGMQAGISLSSWILIVLISTSLVLAIVLPAAVFSSIFAFRRGKSPDDFTIPIVSTVGDIGGILAIIAAIKMVGI